GLGLALAGGRDVDGELVAHQRHAVAAQAHAGHIVGGRLVGGAVARPFFGAVAHAAAGKCAPDGAVVLPIIEQRVGGQDGVGLDGALLLNDVPGHIPNRSAPDFPDVVHLRASGHVGVGERVHAQAGAVGVATDAAARGRLAIDVGAGGPGPGAVGERRGRPVGSHHEREKVAPALAGLLGIAQAAGVDTAGGEAVADAVAVLVRHHAAVVVAIELRAGRGGLGQRYLDTVGYLSYQLGAVGLRYHHRRNRHGVIGT
nr:hypothetical protein [Tanacetum cinerariifolium]